MYFYLPNNLYYDGLLEKHPPLIEDFDKWKLLYFVHIVSYLPSVSKKLRHEESGFVNLSSISLQKVVSNYKKYIEYLLLHDVLEVNQKYLPGVFSKSYRLTLEYTCSPLVNVRVGNNKFAKIAKKHAGISPEERYKVLTEYGHLIRHFEELEYNFEAATKYISSMQYETLGLQGYSDKSMKATALGRLNSTTCFSEIRIFNAKLIVHLEGFIVFSRG